MSHINILHGIFEKVNRKIWRKTIELKDTVELMLSENHEDRFRAEYLQTRIRLEKLHRIIVKMRAERLNFQPKCDGSVDVMILRGETVDCVMRYK